MDREREQQVIDRVRRGEREAFAALVDAYRKPIFNLAWRMTGRLSDAEDLAQETFLRAFEQLPRYDAGRSFYTWLYTLSLNVIRNHLKKAGNRRQSDFAHQGEFPAASDAEKVSSLTTENQEEGWARKQEEQKLEHCLLETPPELREMLVLRFYQDLSFDTIAEITGLTPSAVKMRVYRGLETLRKRMR